jgi:hypothetical protein
MTDGEAEINTFIYCFLPFQTYDFVLILYMTLGRNPEGVGLGQKLLCKLKTRAG